MGFFLKCNEAANICDKSQYKEANLWNKFSLGLHLVMCKLCRNYSKQNTKLTGTLKSAKLKTLRPEEKQRLKAQIEQEMNTLHKS